MKTSAIENKREKWHTNGLTFYYQAGKLCQCRSKRPRLRNGKKKDGTPLQPSPEQIKARKVFKNIIALKHYYFKQIKDLPIWDLAPGEAGQTRLSKFHKVNSEACDDGAWRITRLSNSVSASCFAPSMSGQHGRDGKSR